MGLGVGAAMDWFNFIVIAFVDPENHTADIKIESLS
jgi:hypothetical protein